MPLTRPIVPAVSCRRLQFSDNGWANLLILGAYHHHLEGIAVRGAIWKDGPVLALFTFLRDPLFWQVSTGQL